MVIAGAATHAIPAANGGTVTDKSGKKRLQHNASRNSRKAVLPDDTGRAAFVVWHLSPLYEGSRRIARWSAVAVVPTKPGRCAPPWTAHPELRPKSRVSMKSDLSEGPHRSSLVNQWSVVRRAHHERKVFPNGQSPKFCGFRLSPERRRGAARVPLQSNSVSHACRIDRELFVFAHPIHLPCRSGEGRNPGGLSRAARRCTTAAAESCTTGTMRKD